MTQYSPERFWPRLVPKNAITVSIFNRKLGQAYGLITNISPGGACFDTGVHFEPGSRILVRIRFEPEGNPFTTEAEVVWSREGDRPNSFVHGAVFLIQEEAQRRLLAKTLSSPDFHEPSLPGGGSKGGA